MRRSRNIAVGLLLASALALPIVAVYVAPDKELDAVDFKKGSAVDQLERLSPEPQQINRRRGDIDITKNVSVVYDDTVDEATLDVIATAVKAGGAKKVSLKPADERVDNGKDLVLYVGNWDEDSAGGKAFSALGVAESAGIAAEGYVLASGEIHREQPTVVLDGVDGDGTFYGAQTLRQLLDGNSSIPNGEIRDWPSSAWRGVIEGFYGVPWSDAKRADQLAFYGEHKMNSYVYSPKDDTYLREKWRETYPTEKLDAIADLVKTASNNHVKFTYALSPGLSICYSDKAEISTLLNKFQSLWDVGVRSFAIPLDDISYTEWNCAADQARFGSGGGAAGAAQAYVLNEVQRQFIATHDGADRLQMVPTEYYNVTDSPYKAALRNSLDSSVIVEWTGTAVVPSTITAAQAQAAKTVYGHDILLWDNYPVNDYITDRLVMGPYNQREPGMLDSLIGITVNPMEQAESSKIAEATAADFSWNAAGYKPERSWRNTLAEFAGGRKEVFAALRAFADVNCTTIANPQEAPRLHAAVTAFWPDWQSGDKQNGERAAEDLDKQLKNLEQAPKLLRDQLDSAPFVGEAEPWLAATADWAKAARAALAMLVKQRGGDDQAALRIQQELPDLVAQAGSHEITSLNRTVKVQVAPGVLDTFIDQANAEYAVTLGEKGG